jgi:Spy/CpxP family protein refolding chaperone
MKTRTFITSILVATGFLGATAFQAAAQGGGGGGGGRGGMGMGMNLTEDQRTQMGEAMQSLRTDLAPLNEKLAAAQKEALKAALAKNPDEKTIRAKIEAVNKIQVDIGMLRLKAMKGLIGTLTEEQKTQMDTRPGGAYQMFMGGGMGAMGGGARRGGGGGGGQ